MCRTLRAGIDDTGRDAAVVHIGHWLEGHNDDVSEDVT